MPLKILYSLDRVIWSFTAAISICVPSLQIQYTTKWPCLSVNLHLMSANEWKPINTRFELVEINSYTEILRYHYAFIDNSMNGSRWSCRLPSSCVPLSAIKSQSRQFLSILPVSIALYLITHNHPQDAKGQVVTWHVTADAAWQMCHDSLSTKGKDRRLRWTSYPVHLEMW